MAQATADFLIDNSASDGIPYWDTGAPGVAQLGDWRGRPAEPDNPGRARGLVGGGDRRAGSAASGRTAGRQRRRGGAALHAGRPDHGALAVLVQRLGRGGRLT